MGKFKSIHTSQNRTQHENVLAWLESEPRQASFLLFYFLFLNSRALKISGANVSVHRIETSVGTFTTRMCLRRTGKTLQMTGSIAWLELPGLSRLPSLEINCPFLWRAYQVIFCP